MQPFHDQIFFVLKVMNPISIEPMKEMSDFGLVHFIGDALDIVPVVMIELVGFLEVLGDIVVELFLDF